MQTNFYLKVKTETNLILVLKVKAKDVTDAVSIAFKKYKIKMITKVSTNKADLGIRKTDCKPSLSLSAVNYRNSSKRFTER